MVLYDQSFISYPYFVTYYWTYVFLFKYDGNFCLSWGRGFFLWDFFVGFFSRRYYRENSLMVHLEYRHLLLSFNVGLLALRAGNKLNPLNIELREYTFEAVLQNLKHIFNLTMEKYLRRSHKAVYIWYCWLVLILVLVHFRAYCSYNKG